MLTSGGRAFQTLRAQVQRSWGRNRLKKQELKEQEKQGSREEVGLHGKMV